MALGGAMLRFGSTGVRAIELLCAIVALGIFSYFLAVLANQNAHIANWLKAVEGIAGASVLYLLFAVFLTLCLGGVRFFAYIAVFLDVCFIGAYIAIAWLTRHGANSCTGEVNTPLGSGPAKLNRDGYPTLHHACQLNTAVFAVSVINIFLFVFTAFLQVMLVRHHQKEKRYGPSPSNNYTSGLGKMSFWKRNKKAHNTRDAELATAATVEPHAARHSHDTGYTGSTAAGGYGGMEPKYGEPGYGAQPQTHNYSAPVHNTTTTSTNY